MGSERDDEVISFQVVVGVVVVVVVGVRVVAVAVAVAVVLLPLLLGGIVGTSLSKQGGQKGVKPRRYGGVNGTDSEEEKVNGKNEVDVFFGEELEE